MNAASRALPPRVDGNTLRGALAAQGFALLEGVFDADRMDTLRDALDRAWADESAAIGFERLQRHGQVGYVTDVFRLGAPFLDLLQGPELHRVLDVLFEGDVHLAVAQGIRLEPGMGRGVWPRRWHADRFREHQAMGDPSFLHSVNVLVCLDDLTLENGATAVLVGSHHLASPTLEDEQGVSAVEFRAVAPAGSILLLGGGTWHSAGMNTSPSTRRVLKILFSRPWIRPELVYGDLVPPSLLARLSPHGRRLLGLS